MNNLTAYWDYFLATYSPKELTYNFGSLFTVSVGYLCAVMFFLFIFLLGTDIKKFLLMKKNKEPDFIVGWGAISICIEVMGICFTLINALPILNTEQIKEQYYTINYPEDVMKVDFQKYNLSADEVVTVMKVMEKSKTLSGEYNYSEIKKQINQHKDK